MFPQHLMLGFRLHPKLGPGRRGASLPHSHPWRQAPGSVPRMANLAAPWMSSHFVWQGNEQSIANYLKANHCKCKK